MLEVLISLLCFTNETNSFINQTLSNAYISKITVEYIEKEL